MKELFGKLLDDLKKYKLYLLVYLIVCIIIGVLIGIFSKRTVDEYKMYIEKNLYDIKEIYRDEYSGYSSEELIDEELLNTEEIRRNTTTPTEEIGTTNND